MYKRVKKECIAMLLAGGQGSRLYALTEKNAKPAVPFGGKYRIIDFTLSNCINSGIDTVGVLTQYQPLQLNEYIDNGQAWDLDRVNGGITILPPYQGMKQADWYKGTANAIYQNIQFIDIYDPEYVLILSGDHIYKMNYDKMLEYHKEKKADCTIAVIDVPLSEASRFGIMNLSSDGSGKIDEFEEKPKKPKSNKASMGIYIFKKEKLENYLKADEEDENSSNDFGKNIIPAMLNAGEGMYAYPFEGYWKDVGTIDSLWSANMDLLGDNPVFNLHDRSWRIYSRNYALPPHFIGNSASIKNSIITEGCIIYGKVENSILFNTVTVLAGASITDSIIMNGTTIGYDSEINYSIIDSDVVIGNKVKIGLPKKLSAGVTVVGSEISIPNECIIEDGKMINTKNLSDIKEGDVIK